MYVLVTGNLTESFSQPKLGRKITDKDVLEMKYVLDLEEATLKEFVAQNNGDKINMDTNVCASGPGTFCTVSQIEETYQDSFDVSVKEMTRFTVKEA